LFFGIWGILSLQRANQSGRIACVHARFIDVFCDYCSCSNDGAVTNIYRQDSSIAANGHVVSNSGAAPQIPIASGRATFAKKIIDEHDSMPNETIAANGHQFADKGVGLYFGAFTYDYALLYFNEWSDKRIGCNAALVQITGLNHLYAIAKSHVADGTFKNGGIHIWQIDKCD
jgi:hypothetical protein